MLCRIFTVWMGLTFLSLGAASAQTIKVGASQISVSGVSSGAYMAQQLHIAYSDIFMGMGAVAGGPFYCAQNRSPNEIDTIKQECMQGFGADLSAATYIGEVSKLSSRGQIAPIDNLKNDRVFIFNSVGDQIINPLLGNASRLLYESFVENPSRNIKAWANIPSFGPFYAVAHGMPTAKSLFDTFENYTDSVAPCAPANVTEYSWFPNPFVRGNDPWIYHCNFGLLPGYDMAKDILWHIYGEMHATRAFEESNLYAFDQLPFVTGLESTEALNAHGIGTTGYAYVPEACETGEKDCRLHVALHGCQQFPEWEFRGKPGSVHGGGKVTFGDLFYKNIYNDLAESNDIIMVYPQAHNIGTKDSDINPYGCWAFWAMFDDERDTYYTREGRQMKMIARIVEAFIDGSIALKQ